MTNKEALEKVLSLAKNDLHDHIRDQPAGERDSEESCQSFLDQDGLEM